MIKLIEVTPVELTLESDYLDVTDAFDRGSILLVDVLQIVREEVELESVNLSLRQRLGIPKWEDVSVHLIQLFV